MVYHNTIQSLVVILRAMASLKIEFRDPSRMEDAKRFLSITDRNSSYNITPELASMMIRLWKDDGVRRCVSRSREYQLNDSAE